jgi:FkbM family methyltransferase
MSPGDASETYGGNAAFVVSIWGADKPHRLEHTVAQLSELGCEIAVPVSWLQWRHADQLLPHYAQDLPSRLLAQAAAVRRAFGLLADELSRREFVAQIRWRLTGDPSCLGHPIGGPQYLAGDVARSIDGEVILDCGAYDGDTLADWLQYRGPSFARYIAMEPDPVSRAQLEALVQKLPERVGERVVVLPQAVASAPGTATFAATGTASSTFGAGEGVEVELARIDDLLRELGGPAPTFVKMDIEGAELDAIAGATGLIRDHGPMLALCVYHRQDHLWRVPLAVNDLRPDHRLFLRPHNEEGWDLVLYGVPPGRALS